MNNTFSALVIRHRYVIIAFWLLAAGVLFLVSPRLADVAAYSSQGFLPESSRSKQAEKLLAAITQPRNGQTSLVLTLSRDGGLTPEDEAAGVRLAAELAANGQAWRLKSIQDPWMGPAYREQLLAKNGRTALVILNLDEPAYSNRIKNIVESLRATLRAQDAPAGTASTGSGGRAEGTGALSAMPAGLQVHLTGEAAFSFDEHTLVNQSMDRIAQITVVVVLLVLFLVFRSPVAPLLPLSVIGLSFLISRSIVALMSGAGYTVSAYTETFLIAVLFGAGTDYCLLVISRYREELGKGRSRAEALALTQRWSGPAIVSSGGTVMVGFLCMGLAGFGLFNTTGPSVAIGVGIAILMVMTLTPALIHILGPVLFWPRHPERPAGDPLARQGDRTRAWNRLASFVTRRPVLILVTVSLLSLPLLVSAALSTRSFDQLSELPPIADSIIGFEKITKDFAIGEVMPVKIIIKSDKDLWNNKSLQVLEQVALDLQKTGGITRIRGATRPTGERIDQINDAVKDPSKPFFMPKLVIAANPELKDAMSLYLTEDGHSVYFDAVLSDSPYRHEALDKVDVLRRTAARTIAGTWIDGARVEVGGATAMFEDVRAITAADFLKVMVFVLLGIFVVLVLLLRSLVAPLYLLLTILGSYVVTMGITSLVFMGFFGFEGVNWAVPFFAFCVLVALGVDYNIFLMSRVKEEYRPGHNTRAVALALSETGKIITSCGIIMAGCFSAMMVSPVRSIVEVGFATVLGLLIDTFIIRTLVVPALATVMGELNWWPARTRRGKAAE